MKLYLILAVISFFSILIWQTVYATDNQVRVYVLDVGQGDSILVEIPGETTVLIDGGPGDYVLVKMGDVLPPWIRKIDTVILTHPHADHIEGLLDVVERYRVKQVLFNPVYYENVSWEYFLSQIEQKGIRVQYLNESGYKIDTFSGVQIGNFTEYYDYCGDEISINLDGEGPGGECKLSLNNTSIVTAVERDGEMIMLMGDAEEEVELDIASMIFRYMGYPKLVVLKAGHHCSRTASSEEFLDRVQPDVAICSLGEENTFGHPHAETIENFTSRAISFLRTDEDGSIVIEIGTDGINIR